MKARVLKPSAVLLIFDIKKGNVSTRIQYAVEGELFSGFVVSSATIYTLVYVRVDLSPIRPFLCSSVRPPARPFSVRPSVSSSIRSSTIHLFFRPSVRPSVRHRPSVCSSVRPRPSVRPCDDHPFSVRLSVCPSVCPSIGSTTHPSVRPFVLPFIGSSVRPSILHPLPPSSSPSRLLFFPLLPPSPRNQKPVKPK